MSSSVSDLRLAHGLAFAISMPARGWRASTRSFSKAWRRSCASACWQSRAQPPSGKEESAFLIELAPHLEDFIGALFAITRELQELAERHHALAPVFTCKRLFVQRQALKAHKPEAAGGFDGDALAAALEQRLGEALTELAFARKVNGWMEDEAANKRISISLLVMPPGRPSPRPAGPSMAPACCSRRRASSIPIIWCRWRIVERHGVSMAELDPHHHRYREGFALTDPGTDLTGALDQTHYCTHLLPSSGEGFLQPRPEGARRASFKKSPFQVTLAGCPLEEKISEMHSLKAEGVPLGRSP